ncbi:hypothetical protein HPB50_006854 [Hyalomma asiaticum]|uniref:Uncharacterized protein n=1 Tax=Hyalomma asiaticum TaxID=266040 RepID=A0ACB7T926_HYAAI|nr:hypothetical protein HPB50_006854 [Hyalomma asiaticum]
MKISTAVIICLVGVLIVSTPDVCEAKLGLALAPFVWVGNLAKDAAQTLVAYKLSLATKALAMITGNRSFRATIAYDSQLQRYEEVPAEADHSGVKTECVPSKAKPVVQVPTLPPLPKTETPKAPQVPMIAVPKLVVPKIVMSEVAVPDVVQSKVDLLSSKINSKLNLLGGKSAGLIGGPKYASGYIKGGIRVGHGPGPVAEVQLGSDPLPTPVSPAEPRSSFGKEAEQNGTAHHSRPVRSINASIMHRYFQFIQLNDEGRCIALMVCSMAAQPQDFGEYGRKVTEFFNEVKPSHMSPVSTYRDAYMAGRSGRPCRSKYPVCRVDPQYLAQLGENHA